MCRQCEIKPVYELTNKRKFCEKCFCRLFEKRVFHTVRKYSLLDNAKKIYVLCTSVKGNILFNVLKKAGEKRGIEISKTKKLRTTKTKEKISLENNLDDEAVLIVNSILSKKPDFSLLGPETPIKTKNSIARCIKPLYFCLDREIELYAKIKGINGAIESEEKSALLLKIRNFIDAMEKNHPEIKNAIVNSFLRIVPLLKK